VTGRTIAHALVVSQRELMSRTLAWPIRPLHMDRRIIMSHNLVTDNKYKLTRSKRGTGIAFQIDTSSRLPICVIIPPVTQEPSPCPLWNAISIWQWSWDVLCRGWSLWVQHAWIAEFVTNRALGQAGGTECGHVSAVSANLASYGYSLVEKSLVAFAIFRGCCQESPEAH